MDSASLNFGNVGSALSSHVEASGSLSVRFTAGTGYTLSLDYGQGPGVSGPEDRRMTSGGASLRYGLYQDTARLHLWGNVSGTSVASSGTGAQQAFAVHGRIYAGQTPEVGAYSDIVLITV